MKVLLKLLGLVAAWAALIAIAFTLAKAGIYGVALFAFLPLVMGALVGWSRPVATIREAVVQGGLTAAMGCLFFIILGVEGLICMVMALPLAVPLGMLGSYLSFQTRKTQSGSRTTALLLLPFGLASAGYDFVVTPRVYEVTTSIEVAAPPETVWRYVVSYADMPEPTDWALRTGLGYPRRVRLVGAGVGAIRYCDFSTGSFVEPITVWEPGKRLEFDVVQSPPPMKEWSPYGEIHPAHLHGYFVSKRGRFVLTPLTNGHTRIDGTSWYQHGLEPGPYWRWWSDAIVHRIHWRILNHIKDLSES